MRFVIVGVLTVMALNGQAFAQSRGSLDGWGPVKFGMTASQANAEVGGRLTQRTPILSTYPTSINGLPFTVNLIFQWPGSRLSSVILNQEGLQNLSKDECLAQRDKLQAALTKPYGKPDVSDEIGRDQNVPPMETRTSIWYYARDGYVAILASIGRSSIGNCLLTANYSGGDDAPPKASDKF